MNHIITILITGLLGIIALTGCGKAEEEKRLAEEAEKKNGWRYLSLRWYRY
mgnify:CR=1 FL=1